MMKKLFQKGKRFLALTLAAALSLSGLPAVGGMEAKAFELKAERLATNGGGSVSAYLWRGSNFDVEGILDPSRIGTDSPYSGNDSNSVRATFSRGGYQNSAKVGGDETINGSVSFSSDNGGVVDAGNVEFKLKVYPSKDSKYIIAEYTAYNKTGGAISGVKMAGYGDVMIGSDDGAALERTQRSIKMTHRTEFQVFELITNDPSIGITNRYRDVLFGPGSGGGDFKTNMIIYPQHRSHYFEQDNLTGNRYPQVGVTYYIDTALAYSWDFTLPPYQKVVKKVAFATRGTSLYISQAHGTPSGSGTAADPIDTIENGIAKIVSLNQTMGYLYIQDYDTPINSTINIPSGRTVVLEQADYEQGHGGTDVDTTLSTIKRASGFTGPMFSVDGGIRVGNVTLDGNMAGNPANDSPIIETGNSATVAIQKGAVLKDNIVSSPNKGSAINLNGNATLDMNYGTVTGNKSKDSGAIYNNGSKFTVKNSVDISGNIDENNKECNVVLPVGKKIEVAGPLVDSDDGTAANIKVTVKDVPTASVGTTINSQAQEIVVAEPASNYPGLPDSVADAPAFLANFSLDEEATANAAGLTLESGRYNFDGQVPGATTNNKKKVVLRKAGKLVNFELIEFPDGGALEPRLWDGTTNPVANPDPVSYENGATVTGDNILPPTMPTGAKYTFKDAIIDGSGGTLTVPQTDGYKLTGTMPNNDVTVTYRFERKTSTIKFDVNGGTPATIAPRTGKQLSDNPNRTLPTVTKYGYKLKNWDPTPAVNNSGDEIEPNEELPEKFPKGQNAGLPTDDEVTYKAIWEVDPDVVSQLKVTHKNAAGTIEFKDPVTSPHPVEDDLDVDKLSIPGYLLDVATSNTTPSGIGSFNAGTGKYTGDMPSQDLDVNFRYVPDTSPSAKKTLTVKHIRTSDNVQIGINTIQLAAEDDINASVGAAPLTGSVVAGLTFTEAVEVTQGDAPGAPGTYIRAVEGAYDSSQHAYIGKMPNQDVTLVFKYNATGSGQNLNVSYIDNDAQDPNLRRIANLKDSNNTDIDNPNVSEVSAGQPIESQDITTYMNIYGYNPTPYSMTKSNTSASPDFDTDYHFKGLMPIGSDINVTYTYSRDASKWKRITYKPVEGATLGRGSGRPADLVTNGGELYVDVLMAGDARSYTWENIKDMNLVPEVTLADNTYFVHDGWFIDANNNGKKDSDENLLEDSSNFSDHVTVLPNVIKTPGAWFNVTLDIGDHINKTAGVDTVNTRATETLAQVIAASGLAYDIEPNYLYDGWYMFGNAVALTDNVQNGMTYKLEVKPDPSVFGLAPSAKQAEGSLLPNGRGRVTVYDTKPGYKYVLTDKDGNVVNVKPGNALENTVVFDNLQAGTQYKVYEVSESVTISAGASINSVPAGEKSAPTKVTVPVLDNNYTVTPDPNNDGKTKITINPADPTLEYALVDDAGNLVTIAPEAPNGWQTPTGGNPATVTFSNLPVGKNFTVITRPAGSNASVADRIDGGSKFNSDPGSELEVPTYILETRKAGMAIQSIIRDGNNILSSPTDIYEELHEGDRVTLLAPETDAQGNPFDKWKVNINSAPEITSGTAGQRSLDITIRKANLVISAEYRVAPTVPSLANVQDEVRGGSSKQIALDPEGIEALKNNLTTGEDRVLMDTNHVDVTYKVIYKKSAATATASDAIQAIYTPAAPEAFTAAWQIGVNVERYVNGRKVELPSGHPSNYPGTLTSYVQLDDKDIDMLDYKLYEIDDTTGNVVGEVAMSRNPAEGNGISGLFTFQARVGHSYVLVYNKAFKLSFVNNHVDFYPTASQNPAHKLHTVKVRRGSDSNDAFTDWMNESPILSPYERLGITYTKRGNGWSYTDTLAVGKAGYRAYDPTAAIQKKTVVYAAYDDDSEQVQQASGDLDGLINRLVNLGNDNFLKRGEFSDMKAGIATLKNIAARPGMLSILNSTNPADAALKADFERYATMTEAQLDEIAATLPPAVADKLIKRRPNLREIDAIKRYESFTVTDPVTKQRVKRLPALAERFFQQQLNPRYEGYAGTVSSRSSGGSSGGGGGTGRGTADKPFIPTAPKTYSVGGNGNWEQHADGRWSFVLTGGIRLTSKWGKLEYSTGDRSADGWYHFNSYGLMDTGWFQDEKGNWYYCNTDKDGFQGKMKTGWVYNDTDKNWYYLDSDTGMMRTGWVEVAGKWYYFATQASAQTYVYDAKAEQWNYLDNGVKPMGSMYVNTTTPDGYRVGADGALIN